LIRRARRPTALKQDQTASVKEHPMTSQPDVAPGVDPSVPSVARIYDYMLGGTYNFPADRVVADRAMAQVPELRDIIMANRGFHGRAARWIAEHGVRQFLDLGSGLPTRGNTHDTVRAISPDAKVAYVDLDPMVATYADQLLSSAWNTRVIVADVRDPDRLLADPKLRDLLDFSQPIGLLITGVLHFVADAEDPWRLMARYVGALAPGSYVALTHSTYDNMPPKSVQAGREEYARSSEQMHFRSRAEVVRFFDGLELVEPYDGAGPGLAFMGDWRAENREEADSDGSRWGYCGVGRKP
jgi:O-methyltransferase involved in polyketide biosynthesis